MQDLLILALTVIVFGSIAGLAGWLEARSRHSSRMRLEKILADQDSAGRDFERRCQKFNEEAFRRARNGDYGYLYVDDWEKGKL